jgi:two-component system response regulator AlgR
VRILIADDEAPARERLQSMIEEIGGHRVVAQAANGQAALDACASHEVDLVLMDIRMPVMDGLTAAARLAEQPMPPAVVFVTAYDEHALAAFERSAADYLLKPIRRQRLEKALARVETLTRPQLQAAQTQAEPGQADYISASFRGGLRRIPVDEIIYLHADNKYVTARYTEGEVLLEESLKSLEERFDRYFVRIHRNALVARSRLAGMEKSAAGGCRVLLKGCQEKLEVSRRHLAEVRRLIRQ